MYWGQSLHVVAFSYMGKLHRRRSSFKKGRNKLRHDTYIHKRISNWTSTHLNLISICDLSCLRVLSRYKKEGNISNKNIFNLYKLYIHTFNLNICMIHSAHTYVCIYKYRYICLWQSFILNQKTSLLS